MTGLPSPEPPPDGPPRSFSELARRILSDAELDGRRDLQRLEAEARRDLQRLNEDLLRTARGDQVSEIGRDAFQIPDTGAVAKAVFDGLRELLNPPNIAKAANAIFGSLREAAHTGLVALVDGVGQAFTDAQNSDLWILLELMTPGPGVTLFSLDRLDEERTLAVIERALSDPEYLDELGEQVKARGRLTGPQEERFLNGLNALKNPGAHWTGPRDCFHLAVEDIVWCAAQADGLIDEERKPSVRKPGRPSGPIHSAAALIAHYLFQPQEPIERFFSNRVYGGSAANDARHARTSVDNRRYALYSAVGILALIDRRVAIGERWALRSFCEQLVKPLSLEYSNWREEMAYAPSVAVQSSN